MTRVLLTLFMRLGSLASTATAQMTHEHTTVRTAYAKLGFAIEQGAISQLAMEAIGVPAPESLASLPNDQRIAKSQISITLGDFVTGNAQDILTRKFVDLVNPAVQERLDIELGRHSFHSGQEFQWFEPSTSWQPANPVPSEFAELNPRDFLALQWQQKPPSVWQTDASYSVTVSYQGKTVGPS
jgi:hypothetical protein